MRQAIESWVPCQLFQASDLVHYQYFHLQAKVGRHGHQREGRAAGTARGWMGEVVVQENVQTSSIDTRTYWVENLL